MKYITVLITDTHFGTHNSSITWLKSQKEFFDKQFIPHLKKRKDEGYQVRVIHCGDVFDSRSTINTYIATTVVNLFFQICETVDEFIVVGGNHDYFSPVTDNVDTIRLVFNQLSLTHNHFKIITTNKQLFQWGNECGLMIPWYEWMDQDKVKDTVKKYHPTHIFTHADLPQEKPIIDCPNIISGHIHTPYFKDNIKNLGSCFALTFTDANQPRGFYEYEDGGELKFIENEHSIRFWRFYDKEILKIPDNVHEKDYIELYANKTTLAKKKYVDICVKWTDKFKNIWIIPQIDQNDTIEIKNFEGYNIETMIETLIPVELKDKFERIKQYDELKKDLI